jgi:hypothetical protein
MSHIHWVTRQNKLEIPKEDDEVNTREIHNHDGQPHDPDTMVVPLTPKSTRKAEVLTNKSRRRRCSEGSGIATVSFRELHS